jgi:hypothetical protein
MDWAARRKWIVIGTLGGVAFAFLLVVGFATFYETPTCTDGTQNGKESGIDCGGSCSKVCSAEAANARVRFARTLVQSGRTDLIAYIDNPNQNAYAKNAQVLIDVYRQDGHILEKRTTITIPAKGSTPLFIPAIANYPVQQVFVSLAPGEPVWTQGSGWEKEPAGVETFSIVGSESEPRITATVTNPTAYPKSQVPFVATVFDEMGVVIAASQTVVTYIPPQGSAQAVFTWNEPFSAPNVRVEIVPLVTLPRSTP